MFQKHLYNFALIQFLNFLYKYLLHEYVPIAEAIIKTEISKAVIKFIMYDSHKI